MNSYGAGPDEGPVAALVKAMHLIREARERRIRRALEERAGDIEWARTAPTVQESMGGSGR